MSSVGVDDRPRLLLDEATFDFRGTSVADIESDLDRLSDCILDLRGRGHAIAKYEAWHEIECHDDGVDVLEYLTGRASGLDRSTATRLISLLDKCPDWDTGTPGVPTDVAVDSEVLDFAPTLGYALASGVTGRAVACLVLGRSPRRGHLTVRDTTRAADVFAFADAGELPPFWRSLYAREAVPESGFFTLARDAFPGLEFHHALSFGRFEGSYLHTRDRVVQILGLIEDHFAIICAKHSGLPSRIQADLGPLGLDLSPESPGTRASNRLMALRDVHHDGKVHRCEWHAKLELHRNRIHFTLPSPDLDGRILIGIFVRHLDT